MISAKQTKGSSAQSAKSVHELFEEQARAKPQSTAVIFKTENLTYEELDVRANQLAWELKKFGVKQESRVGICLPRSSAIVISLLAVLKAGGVCLPLDPNAPISRLAHILEEAHASAIITSAGIVPESLSPTRKIILISDSPSITEELSRNLQLAALPDNGAYITYTSGSTGQPQGVIKTHQGILSALAWTRFNSADVCCHNIGFNFGFSLASLFLPLISGVPLVITDDIKDANALMDTLLTHGVTNVSLVPNTLEELLLLAQVTGGRPAQLRRVITGGTAFASALIDTFERALPEGRLFNQYGSSETGPAAIGELTGRSMKNSALIGSPLPNTRIYILDEQMNPCAQGEIGELYVVSPQMARGYVSQPALTASRFVANPFHGAFGERLYRTGDLGRTIPGGEIEFGGRRDRQVKIKGHRVELGEVEAALMKHERIGEAIVTTWKKEQSARLVAYVVSNGGSDLSASQLRSFLLAHLPDYMVPSAFVFLTSLPRNANGKIDFDNLPIPNRSRPHIDQSFEAPRNSTEAVIAEIWADLLGIDAVGIRDNLFELGGDSLAATRIATQISHRFDIELPLLYVFDNPTVAEIATRLTNDLAINGDRPAH
jgi:amino acid adenylation domain-containing protein